MTVYSNQRKVALYVDGVLFEFGTNGPEFHFRGYPREKNTDAHLGRNRGVRYVGDGIPETQENDRLSS